jgi:hypothetical protein
VGGARKVRGEGGRGLWPREEGRAAAAGRAAAPAAAARRVQPEAVGQPSPKVAPPTPHPTPHTPHPTPHTPHPTPHTPHPTPRGDRYKLGLYQPPLPPLELPPGEEQEWIELRPRWPLTAERHAGSTGATRSSKAASKMARSLTDETREALAAPAIGGGEGGGASTPAPAAAAAGGAGA